MYETLKAIVPHSTGEILYNLPLVMENKELIQSSFITYNVDIGVKYLCLDGCNPPLYLGDMLSLWGQKEESIWHFYSKGSTEVYTFLVKEMREGLLLCLGWNLEAGHIEVYTVKERKQSENLQSTFDFLNYANRPVSGQKEKLSLAPVIMSGLNSTDIMTALQDGISFKTAYMERIKREERQKGQFFDSTTARLIPYLNPTSVDDPDYIIQRN